MNLYSISEIYQAAMNELSADDFDAETIADTLEGLEGAFSDKVLAVAAYIKNLESESSAIKNAADAMKSRHVAIDMRAAKMREYLLDSMIKVKSTSVTSPELTVKTKVCPPSVSVDKEEIVPELWFTTKIVRSLNKSAASKHLKGDNDIPGLSLARNTKLDIK